MFCFQPNMEDTVPDLRASPRRNSAALKPMLGKKSIKKRLANWVSIEQKKTTTKNTKPMLGKKSLKRLVNWVSSGCDVLMCLTGKVQKCGKC